MPRPSFTGRYQLALIPAVFILATAGGASARAQAPVPDSAVQLRYDLRPGDHLIYKQTLVREVDGRRSYGIPGVTGRLFGEPVESRLRVESVGHVVIAADSAGDLVAGFQRTLSGVEIERYVVGGEDRLAAQRQALEQRVRGDSVVAEANRVTARGSARLPWSAVREAQSRLLWDVHEIQPLPAGAVRVGSRWSAENAFGYTMRAVAWEQVDDERCLRAEGAGLADLLFPGTGHLTDSLRLRYWFCPASGLMRRLEFEGTHPNAGFQKVVERIRLELVERRRGEHPRAWLDDAYARQAVLTALQLADSIPVSTEDLYELLAVADAATRTRILGLAYRRRLPPPPVAVLDTLSGSESARVRALAVRVLESVPVARARSLIERAHADSDYFVRDAAAAWMRRQASSGEVPRTVTDSAGRCAVPREWPALAARSRTLAAQPVGTQVRGMGGQEWGGWPYVIQVPEEYRGDQPVPLLVYLAGNSGAALEGLQIANDAFEDTGYLVLYPNAGAFWWDQQATAMLHALLEQTMRQFNVDPDRIYVTGLSNGGTGAFFFSSLWPHRFSAAVSAMGAGFYSFAVSAADRPFPTNVANLPLLFLHGRRDAVISDSATRGTVRALTGRRAPLEMHLFDDRGHSLTPGRGDDGMTLRFLQRFTGRAAPRRLQYRTVTLRNPRHYWLEVLERAEVAPVRGEGNDRDLAQRVRDVLSGRSVVEVTASISDDNVVRLDTRNVRRLRLLLRPDLLPGDAPVRVVLNGREVFRGALSHDCALLERTWQATGDPYLAYSAELAFDADR
ncbi:MAG TPA: dienelactone hydrolase family protein [Gemmatimonadaceae bacterium]|nr:dienelactone hydrolase family protein [Gemmatimonadaceae bacterium]